MSKIKPVFRIKRTLKDYPKFEFESGEKEVFDTWLDSFLGGHELILEIYERKYLRTLPQNSYYWNCVVRLLAETFGWDDDTMHDFLKGKFLSKFVNWKGKEIRVVGSTARLNTAEFSEYVEKCKVWATSEGVIIPEAERVSG